LQSPRILRYGPARAFSLQVSAAEGPEGQSAGLLMLGGQGAPITRLTVWAIVSGECRLMTDDVQVANRPGRVHDKED
jgi:hypothetical protein